MTDVETCIYCGGTEFRQEWGRRGCVKCVQVVRRRPEELGWRRVRGRLWRKPNGEWYLFPPAPVPEVLEVFEGGDFV